MNKIKNLIYLFALSIAVIGCQNDINSNAEGVFTPANEVTIGFTDSNDNLTVLEDGGTVTYEVALSKALPYNLEVELNVVSSDGSLASSGIDEFTSSGKVVITAGSTTASFTFTFNNDTLNDNLETYTVTIGNAITTDGTLTEQYLTISAEPGTDMRTINVADSLPVVVVTTLADVDFNFSWMGGSDLDCRLRTDSGTTIDTGYSVTPGETVTLPQNAADGTYIFSIRPWTVTSTSVNYSVDFVSPAGTETFNGILIDGTNSWTMEVLFLQIEKVTSGTQVTYTLSKL